MASLKIGMTNENHTDKISHVKKPKESVWKEVLRLIQLLPHEIRSTHILKIDFAWEKAGAVC